MKKIAINVSLSGVVICCLIFFVSLIQMQELLSTLDMISSSKQTVAPSITDTLDVLLNANLRIQILFALLVCFALGALVASRRVFRELESGIKKLDRMVKNRSKIIKEKSELVQLLSAGVEVAIVIVNEENEFKWGNSHFCTLFNIKRLQDKSKFDEFIFDRLTSIEESNGMGGAVQIAGVVDQDFILRRFVDHNTGDTVYSFYPIKLYFKEYIQGKNTDSLYEELGDNIFELFSIVDETCCSIKSHFSGVRYSQPDGRLPVLVRGEEDEFIKGLSALVKAVFYIASKSKQKSVQIHYNKNHGHHGLSFRIPEYSITTSVLEDKFAVVNSSLNVSEVFRKVEFDLKRFGADLLVKNIEIFNEGTSANIELNFTSVTQAKNNVSGDRIEI